jgi:type III secretion protein R
VKVLLLLAALSVAPFAVLMVTSFVKISVVLSLVRSAIGVPDVPPAFVVTGLAVLLSVFVMAPTGEAVWRELRPAIARDTGQDWLSPRTADALIEGSARAREPVRSFLEKHAHAKDRALFLDLARKARPGHGDEVGDRDLVVLAPAFVISQLAEAFQVGFMLFVPFLVVDLVVATILQALGMLALSPLSVSLPFKLLLFVLVDGWRLLAQGLVGSYT